MCFECERNFFQFCKYGGIFNYFFDGGVYLDFWNFGANIQKLQYFSGFPAFAAFLKIKTHIKSLKYSFCMDVE